MAKTRKLALEQGKKLGISGAHKMPDGTYHPGATHAIFVNAKKKSKK